MKFFHNDKVSLGWAIAVEIAVHALFAFQAFLLGGFLGEIALGVVFGAYGAKIGAIGLAIFIFGAAFQAFVLGEYMREHVESFEATTKGNGSYLRSYEQVRWLVAAIEVSSLLFRCYTIILTGDWVQMWIILIMGVVALWYAFAQAKVIHASVNRPVEHDVISAREVAGRDIVDSAIKLIPSMTAEQKRRFYTGDLSAVDEAESSNYAKLQEKLQVKEEKLQVKQERKNKDLRRQQKAAEDYAIGQDYASRLLGEPQQQQQPFLKAVTDKQAGNGHQRNA